MRVEIDAGIATIELDHPPANALDTALLVGLERELERLRALQPRGVLLTGRGERFFSAGGDMKELATLDVGGGLTRLDAFHGATRALEEMPWPVACAVNGTAVGGGTELLLVCDFCAAARGARFGFPELEHGLMPSQVSLNRARRRLGERAVRAMLLSGRLFDADDAARMGLVDLVSDDAQAAREAALNWLERTAAKPAVLVASAKHALCPSAAENRQYAERTAAQFSRDFDDPSAVSARERFAQRRGQERRRE